MRRTAVPVRLTLGERDQLADTARDLGISISTYIPQVVLSRPLPPRRAVRPIPEVNRETHHALGRVGGLLNQVAHRLNERRTEDGAADLLEVLQSVAQLLARFEWSPRRGRRRRRVIAKITRGSGFGGVVRYVLDERKGLVPEHQPEIIGGNMAGRTSGELVREFSAVRWLRPDVRKPVEHVSVSFGKSERPLSNDDMSRLVDEYLRRRGLDLERVQYVVVRHRDKGHQHCHLVLNRVRTDLKLVPQPFRDYVRNKEICRSLERDFSLKPVRSDSVQGRIHEWAPSRGEERMKRDRGIESVKERLRALIRGAARGEPTMTAFVNRLEAEGVQVRANLSRTTGHVSGISFQLEGVAVKGSKLGHGYTFLGLQRDQGVRFDQRRDLAALERVSALTVGQEPMRGIGRLPSALATRSRRSCMARRLPYDEYAALGGASRSGRIAVPRSAALPSRTGSGR